MTTNQPALTGAFDGFEGYRTVTEADTQEALRSGLVVVDTNVLLNLYRYDGEAQADLFKVLEAVGDRLFVPHRVMLEFWRNRESAARERPKTVDSVIEQLDSALSAAQKSVREWANRLGVASASQNELLTALANTFEAVSQTIEASAGSDEIGSASDTSKDEVLQRLAALLEGRVGASFAQNEHADAIKEGLRRVQQGEPPGFKDQSKGEDAAGDYLVWLQSLLEAKRRAPDVSYAMVFVTGDAAADDWYRKEGGEIRGPRVELYDEAAAVAGVALFMLRPPSLVFHAQAALNLDIEAETVGKLTRSEDIVTTPGWTADNAERLFRRLEQQGPVQRGAILRAVQNGGFVSRDEVYELGGYAPERTLRGFTRPATRVTRELQERGYLSDVAPDPLRTVYDPKQSYVQTAGFEVPRELLESAVVPHETTEPEATGSSAEPDDLG